MNEERGICSDPRRRAFLATSVAAGALLAFSGRARAQVHAMTGEIYVNGQRAQADATLRAGDRILTGPDSTLTFAVGQDAFHVRQLTSFQVEATGALVSGLRILTGALVGVFGKGPKQIRTATVTAGIRGTGVYIEANPVLTYFCTCYGEVDLECVGYKSTKRVSATNHSPNYVFAEVLKGASIVDAPRINHTNAELAMLERLVGRESPLKS